MEYNFNILGPQMLSVAIVMIGIMVFFAIIEFNLTPVRDIHIQKEVKIEAFDNNDGFCKTHEGDRNKLQKSCSELTRDNCLATSCCVYAKMEGNEQCHSGDINGPTFKRDKSGKTKNIDYYYFRNKCIGNGCKV
jgi:hypothetical protein